MFSFGKQSYCLFLLILFLLTGLIPVRAQKAGFMAGASICNQHWKSNDGNKIDHHPIAGYHVGIKVELDINTLLTLQSGLMLNNTGYKHEQNGVNYKNTIVYSTLPVMLKVGPQDGLVKFYGIVGFYMGFAITAIEITKYEGNTEYFRLSLGNDEISDEYRKFDYGAHLGAGLDWRNLSLNLIWSPGFANIYPSGQNTIRNQSLGLWVGYNF